MESGLQPDKLVSKRHYVYYFLYSDRYWKEGMSLHVLVNNVPDLRKFENRQKVCWKLISVLKNSLKTTPTYIKTLVQVLKMVHSFENTPHTFGRQFTMFFLYEYMDWLQSRYAFLDSSNATDEFSTRNLKPWLSSTGSRLLWMSHIRWGNESRGENPDTIMAFRFTVRISLHYLVENWILW